MKLLPVLRHGFIACSVALTAPANANIRPMDAEPLINSVAFYDSPLIASPISRSVTYDPIPNCAEVASELIGNGKFTLTNGVPVLVVCRQGASGNKALAACATDGIHTPFCLKGNATSKPQNMWDAALSILEAYRRHDRILETGKLPASFKPR